MAPRNPKTISVEAFRGVNSFRDPSELPPDEWPEALNVVVNPTGNAAALRSPANFNTALSTGNPVLSGTFYDRQAGGLVLFDINASSGANVATYVTSNGPNTLIRSSQADARWQSINVNNRLFRVNGTEFVQVVTSLAVYAVGITKPAAAPTISIAAGTSTLTLVSGVTASYAYVNANLSPTDVGECSAVSNSSGVATNEILRIPVVASSQTGVSGIVLFISQDAGSVRYLVVDTNDDPVVYANTTGNIDLTAEWDFNAHVTETVFNAPPASGARFLFSWKNRVMACAFTGAATRQQLIYSGFDQIFYGTPWCTYPPLNVITIPNKAEAIQGGTDTPVGALVLSDWDAYLVTGTPTDKVDSGENTLQPTEQLRQLGWRLGTRSPLTIQKTPFGVIWLDQYKHLQFWAYQGGPREICIGLDTELDDIQDTDAARSMAEAVWVHTGLQGGFYVLTASTSGSTNNRIWIVTIINTPEGMFIGGAPSDVSAQCIFNARLVGEDRCFIGLTDRLREILDFDTEGAGWPAGTKLYFDSVTNNDLLYSTLFAIRYNGVGAEDVVVQVRNVDDSDIEALSIQETGGSFQGLVNRYGTRQKLRFNFPDDDDAYREIANLRFVTTPKRRVL